MEKTTQAMTYSRQALVIAQNVQSKELIAASYRNLAYTYADLYNYKESNRYMKLLLDMRDTIFKEESTKSYAEMESRYQNEKKQKEIILLKKDNDIKDLDISNQRRTRTFLLVTLGFIVLVALLIYRSYAAKKRLSYKLGVLNEKLNEANQSKTKLLSIITHDLRTPVSNLFNFLQLQKSPTRRLTPEQNERYNKQINDTAEHVLNTMEDLLIWSKSQMEKFEPVLENVNLSDFFDEIINLNNAGAGQKNIILSKDCPEDLCLETDPNFLKISVRNLVGNAIKFTPQNGAVTLMAYKHTDDVCIAVKDNGEGIPKDQVATIFNWNSIRSDSSGLGLRLAKEFSEKLGGTIAVNSEIGLGTSFILSFKDSCKMVQ